MPEILDGIFSRLRDPLSFLSDGHALIALLPFLLSLALLALFVISSLVQSRRHRHMQRHFDALQQIAADITASSSIPQAFTKVTEHLEKVLKFDALSFALLENSGKIMSLFATSIHGEKILGKGMTIPTHSTILQRVIDEAKPLTREQVAPEDLKDLHEIMLFEEGFQSFGMAPLLGRSGLLGVVSAARKTRASFSPAEVLFLSRLGAQIGPIIENIRLIERERRRIRQLEVISNINNRMLSTLFLQDLLDETVKGTQENFRYARVAIYLVEPETASLSLKALADGKQARGAATPSFHKPEKGAIETAIEKNCSVAVNDLSREMRMSSYWPPSTLSEAAVPIRVDDRVFGILHACDDMLNSFPEEDVTVLETIAAQIANAVKKTQLYTEIKQTKDYLENLIGSSVDAILTTDAAGIITFCNRGSHETLGLPPDALIGRPLKDCLSVYRDTQEQIQDMLRSEGKIINYETLFLSKHGERIPVSLSASVLKASGNPSRETVYIIKNKSLEKKLEDQLKQEYMHMIRTLAGVIEMKDEYTGAHISRVTSWSLRIAERMGLSEEEKRNIEIGATLHDIGKIGIPETILKKPALLSDPERVRIQDHPTLGARVLSSLESFGTVVDIVRYHHENYDGSGYPYGLAGDEIPLGARIVAVADSFDAMNTDREYRKKIGLEKSLEILEAEAGKQFDPEIVRIFVDIIREEQQSEKKNTEKIGNL